MTLPYHRPTFTRREALGIVAMGVAATALGCARRQETTAPSRTEADSLADLDRRHEAMVAASATAFGPGGLIVLRTGYEALGRGRARGKWADVGLEDLWAHAIKEGSILFEDPNKRWGKTGPEETKDLIGQTTIGPWQMTVHNVRAVYGPRHGASPDWSDAEVYAWARENPRLQAAMIADLIAENYRDQGVRNPYAIQRYFWLEAFAKGQIGQGPWDSSVLATPPPGGSWKDLTDEDKRRTGFYGKQLVCGTKTNPRGLLYWLAVTNDADGIRALLRAWRDATKWVWDDTAAKAVATAEPAGMAIVHEDLKYLVGFAREHALVAALVDEVRSEG